MKQITSKRSGKVQYIDDDDWAWLVRTKRAGKFNMIEMPSIKLPKMPLNEKLPVEKTSVERVKITKTKNK